VLENSFGQTSHAGRVRAAAAAATAIAVYGIATITISLPAYLRGKRDPSSGSFTFSDSARRSSRNHRSASSAFLTRRPKALVLSSGISTVGPCRLGSFAHIASTDPDNDACDKPRFGFRITGSYQTFDFITMIIIIATVIARTSDGKNSSSSDKLKFIWLTFLLPTSTANKSTFPNPNKTKIPPCV